MSLDSAVEAAPRPQSATVLTRALRFLENSRARHVRELLEFLALPSVSIERDRAPDVRRCAQWLARHLAKMGLEQVTIIPTRGLPVVYASAIRSPRLPTVLIYGHYDVQPTGPASAWRNPPFSPKVEGGYIWARGASDDKGQLFAHIKAVEAFLATSGRLPVNLRFVFEGEEEIDSLHFADFVKAHHSQLRADVAVISDTRILAPDEPTLTYSLRGHLRLEVKVRTLPRDLHSGHFGGAAPGALEFLARALARLHDESGRIRVPGFYDDVVPVSSEERAFMARMGPSDARIRQSTGARCEWGEPGYSAYERTTIRPSITVSGIAGGHTMQGVRATTVAAATGKLSIRFVPNQDPGVLRELLFEFVKDAVGDAADVAVEHLSHVDPAQIPREHVALRAASRAFRRAFGRSPRFVRSGGTIGVVKTFEKALRIPTVLMGFGLPADGAHTVDERFALDQLFKGMATSAAFLWELGR